MGNIIIAIAYMAAPFLTPLAWAVGRDLWWRQRIKKRKSRNISRDALRSLLPPSYVPTIKKRFMVDFIDTRDTSLSKFSIPVQRRITLAVLLLIGVCCVLLGYNTSGADFWRAAFITYVILMIALLKSPKKIVQERENNKEAVTDFVVKFLMGVRENVEVQFKQYDIDLMTPTRIQVNIPPLAKEEHLKGFLEQLTERFGKTRDWIKDTKTGNGWDTSTHTLDVRMTPPIPSMALFHENYLFHEGISPSFFPLALSNNGGIEFPDPINEGETVHLIGVDLDGDQEKYAEKAGLIMEPIASAPHVLVTGKTGGGKAIDVNTLVLAIRQFREEAAPAC